MVWGHGPLYWIWFISHLSNKPHLLAIVIPSSTGKLITLFLCKTNTCLLLMQFRNSNHIYEWIKVLLTLRYTTFIYLLIYLFLFFKDRKFCTFVTVVQLGLHVRPLELEQGLTLTILPAFRSPCCNFPASTVEDAPSLTARWYTNAGWYQWEASPFLGRKRKGIDGGGLVR